MIFRKVKPCLQIKHFFSNQYLSYQQLRLENHKIYEEIQPIIEKEQVGQVGIFDTKYGKFPTENLELKLNYLEKIEGIYYINQKHSKNFIITILKQDPNSLIVIEPETSTQFLKKNYKDLLQNYQVKYFGNHKLIKNPFRNCQNYLQIYHLSYKIHHDIYTQLNRILIIYKEKQQKNQDSQNINEIVDPYPDPDPDPENQSSQQSQNQINLQDQQKIDELQISQDQQNNDNQDKKLILTTFSQYMENIQQFMQKKTMTRLNILQMEPFFVDNQLQSFQYIKLIENFFKTETDFLKKSKKLFEIGYDNGIISLAFKVNFPNIIHIIATDQQKRDTTQIQQFKKKMNFTGRFQFFQIDMEEILTQMNSQQFRNKFKYNKFDLIISKPPYLPVVNISKSHLENQQILHKYHQQIFEFAKKHLTKNGKFLLIFCDIASIIQLQSNQYVECLCEEFNLQIINKTSEPLGTNVKDKYDPLKNIKYLSRYILYEISHPISQDK